MAEIGTIAASLQLADTALKLRKLWADIRDAPKDVDDLVEEVALQADLLADVQNANLPDGFITTDSWNKCYRLFQKAATALEELTDELSRLMKSYKRTGAVRLWLRKDDLHRSRDRLQRVQATMMLAQQAYAFALSTQQTALIMREIRALPVSQPLKTNDQTSATTTVGTHVTGNSSPDLQLASAAQSASHTQHVISSIECQTGTYTSARFRNTRTTYSFSLPTWVLRKSFQILLQRSNNSLGITFRVYNHLSLYSELFVRAESGEWDIVFSMLTKGSASIFDLNCFGKSLLHCAVEQQRINECRILMDHGLNPLCNDGPAGAKLWTPFGSNFWTHSDLDLLKILWQNADDIDLEDPKFWSSNRCTWLKSDVIRVIRTLLASNNYTICPLTRARLALSNGRRDLGYIHAWLHDDLSVLQALKLLSQSDDYFDASIVTISALQLARPLEDKVDNAGWSDVVKQIVMFQCYVQTTFLSSSPYLEYVDERFFWGNHSVMGVEDVNNTLTSLGREWLQILKRNGADLRLYGEVEKYHLRHMPPPKLRLSWVSDTSFEYVVKFLATGPEVEDWKIFADWRMLPKQRYKSGSSWYWQLEDVGYELAGAFWHLVENPELFGVPGAYVDFEDESQVDPWAPDPKIFYPGPIM